MRRLSYLLLLSGAILFLYPFVSEWLADREQLRLLRQAEQAIQTQPAVQVSAAVTDEAIAGLERVSRLLEDLSAGDSEGDSSDTQALHPEEAASDSSLSPPENPADSAPRPPATASSAPIIGTIEIPSIKVKMPLLAGATMANMNVGAAHMTETTAVGEVGNAAIAAHRARTKGRQFNRLDEVKIGDEIVIRSKTETYVYTVYQTSIVEPTDVSVLAHKGSDKIITLITCDPVDTATHRLIVHGKIIEPSKPTS